MNVVAENHAEQFGLRSLRSRDALIAAVIGEGLRDSFEAGLDELPAALVDLLRTLDDVGAPLDPLT